MNMEYTTEGLSAALCERPEILSAIATCEHPKKAKEVTSKAAKLLVEFSAARGVAEGLVTPHYISSFEAQATRHVRENIGYIRAPDLYGFFFGWETLLLSLISAAVQALIKWYFFSDDGVELRRALNAGRRDEPTL